MSTGLFLILTGLALADALNPFTVAAQAYLLGTPRPMPRSLAFLAGTFVTYFLGGVLLLQGWGLLLAYLSPLVPPWGFAAGEIALGLTFGALAAWSFRQSSTGTPFAPPQNLSIAATVLFAVASTGADLSSALPYFAAVNRIAAEIPQLSGQLLALAWYNLLYCAPLLALIVVRVTVAPASSEAIFRRLRTGIDWALAKLLPPTMAVAAVALIIDGSRRLIS